MSRKMPQLGEHSSHRWFFYTSFHLFSDLHCDGMAHIPCPFDCDKLTTENGCIFHKIHFAFASISRMKCHALLAHIITSLARWNRDRWLETPARGFYSTRFDHMLPLWINCDDIDLVMLSMFAWRTHTASLTQPVHTLEWTRCDRDKKRFIINTLTRWCTRTSASVLIGLLRNWQRSRRIRIGHKWYEKELWLSFVETHRCSLQMQSYFWEIVISMQQPSNALWSADILTSCTVKRPWPLSCSRAHAALYSCARAINALCCSLQFTRCVSTLADGHVVFSH